MESLYGITWDTVNAKSNTTTPPNILTWALSTSVIEGNSTVIYSLSVTPLSQLRITLDVHKFSTSDSLFRAPEQVVLDEYT